MAVVVGLAACGGTPRAARPVEAPKRAAPVHEEKGHLAELETPRKKLLAIDWNAVKLTSDADALALWQQIAPTGDDWEEKLDEIPSESPIGSQLAVALLREGNFTCVAPGARKACGGVPVDVPDPAPNATLTDPCLRRLLAMWAIGELDAADDLPSVRDALKAIAQIPPPESQLTETALRFVPESDQPGRLELMALAYAAGQRDVVNGMLGSLEVPFLIEAGMKHHIDGALQVLSAEAHRPAFLSAVTDDKMPSPGRAAAIVEIAATEEKLSKDLHTALVSAARAKDCGVAAAAARVLVQHGERKFAPTRPHAKKAEPMMRALCVLASYEQMQRADEPSYLLHFIPQKGLELVKTTYDEYADPPTEQTSTVVPRNEVVLPEIEDLVRAFSHCSRTTCTSDDHEFRFTFKSAGGELMLTRMDIVERPPCKTSGNSNP